MSEPTSQTVEPSRTHPAVPTLLTLAGLMGGFYLLLTSALPISPLTGVDWLILTLTTIAIIWAQRISQTGAWTILSGFFIGLLGVSFFAKAPDTSYTITAWCYGGEQGVLGALLAAAFPTRVRFWFLKKPAIRMGFFLLIALGLNLFFGYQQLSLEPNIFWGFSVILLATGFSAALLLGVLRRATLKKKTTPATPKKAQPNPRKRTQSTQKPKSVPAKHIQPQKKTQTPPTSKKHQKKKKPSPTAHPSAQKETPAPAVPEPTPKPAPAQETKPAIPQPNVTAPKTAPDSPSEQDDLSSAYDLLDRIKKKQ